MRHVQQTARRRRRSPQIGPAAGLAPLLLPGRLLPSRHGRRHQHPRRRADVPRHPEPRGKPHLGDHRPGRDSPVGRPDRSGSRLGGEPFLRQVWPGASPGRGARLPGGGGAGAAGPARREGPLRRPGREGELLVRRLPIQFRGSVSRLRRFLDEQRRGGGHGGRRLPHRSGAGLRSPAVASGRPRRRRRHSSVALLQDLLRRAAGGAGPDLVLLLHPAGKGGRRAEVAMDGGGPLPGRSASWPSRRISSCFSPPRCWWLVMRGAFRDGRRPGA